MKQLFTVLAMVVFSTTFNAVAQHPEWIQFQSPAFTRMFEEQGNYIWTGSSSGMYRINKQTGAYENFNNANSPLPDNYIMALENVGDSILWIGTFYGGLVKLQGDVWTVYDTTNSPLYSNRIATLDSDENGVLWVGSAMVDYDQLGMTARFDGVNWTVFDTLMYPNELHVEDTNTIWIRRGEEVHTLVKFDGEQIVEEFNPWNWSPSCPWCFTSFEIDIHGNKWLESDSLVKFDDTTFTKYSADTAISYGLMHIDTDTLWFPIHGGFARFANEEWTFYQKPDSIEGPINQIEIDSYENKWFSIFGEGIYKATDTVWSEIVTGMPFGYTLCIAVDGEGNVWAGSTQGLGKYDGSDWILYDTSNSLLPVTTILELAVYGNTVWAATSDAGLVRIQDDEFTIYDTTNSELPSNKVFTLAVDQEGVVWTGSGDPTGLSSFNGEEWTTYTTSNSGITDNVVRKVVVDHENNLWLIGQTNQGPSPDMITRFDGTDWSTFFTPEYPQYPNNGITDIAVDTNNAIWVSTIHWNGILEDGAWTIQGEESSYLIYIDPEGTRWMYYGGGLARWDGTSWFIFNTNNSGIPSNHVTDLATDSAGTLWVSTYEGVAAYNPEGFPVATPLIDVSQDNLTLYPNPAGDYVNILLPPNQYITRVQIFDLQGKLYRELKRTSVIQTSDFRKGIYLVEVQTRTGIYRGKLIK